jgi:hypothetical protein
MTSQSCKKTIIVCAAIFIYIIVLSFIIVSTVIHTSRDEHIANITVVTINYDSEMFGKYAMSFVSDQGTGFYVNTFNSVIFNSDAVVVGDSYMVWYHCDISNNRIVDKTYDLTHPPIATPVPTPTINIYQCRDVAGACI